MTYERITCDDVEVGDRIARAKTHEFFLVHAIDEGPISRRLHLADTPPEWGPEAVHFVERRGNIRPRRTALLWREA